MGVPAAAAAFQLFALLLRYSEAAPSKYGSDGVVSAYVKEQSANDDLTEIILNRKMNRNWAHSKFKGSCSRFGGAVRGKATSAILKPEDRSLRISALFEATVATVPSLFGSNITSSSPPIPRS